MFEIRVLSYCCWRGDLKSLKLQCDTLFYSHINSQEEVAKEFGIPVQFQRFWLWAKRQNHTYRPNRTLTPQEEAQSVSVFLFVYFFCSVLLVFGISYLDIDSSLSEIIYLAINSHSDWVKFTCVA